MKSFALHNPRTIFARLAAALLVALVAVFCTISAASAHDELISSDPVSGSTISKSPEKIVLDFSGELQQLAGTPTSVVALSDEDDNKVASEATTKGKQVTVVPAQKLASGKYKLVYRVVSSDGHPISNSINFTVKLPATASATPSATATASAEPTASAEASEQPVQQASASVSPVIWVVIGVVILGAAIAVLVKFTRQNK